MLHFSIFQQANKKPNTDIVTAPCISLYLFDINKHNQNESIIKAQ